MDMIKAIETHYNGYRFRSRLEARWAVFFDAVGASYEYEKEGFDLDSGLYLPDFWFPMISFKVYPKSGYWTEIKATKPTQEEVCKMHDLVKMTGHHGFIISGNPWPGEFDVFKFYLDRSNQSITMGKINLDHWDKWSYIPLCYLDMATETGSIPHDLAIPYQKARSARFEHGEVPA